MKHLVSGMFVCRVEGDTIKEVIDKTYEAIKDGEIEVHIMSIEGDCGDGKNFTTHISTTNN